MGSDWEGCQRDGRAKLGATPLRTLLSHGSLGLLPLQQTALVVLSQLLHAQELLEALRGATLLHVGHRWPGYGLGEVGVVLVPHGGTQQLATASKGGLQVLHADGHRSHAAGHEGPWIVHLMARA